MLIQHGQSMGEYDEHACSTILHHVLICGAHDHWSIVVLGLNRLLYFTNIYHSPCVWHHSCMVNHSDRIDTSTPARDPTSVISGTTRHVERNTNTKTFEFDTNKHVYLLRGSEDMPPWIRARTKVDSECCSVFFASISSLLFQNFGM